MINTTLRDAVKSRILPNVQTPAQYIGGELHSQPQDHRECLGSLCLAFPDTYSLGMSHHGLQVLYSLMNDRGWACERAFTPLPDFEAGLRALALPLYGLETFTPLANFDVLGFSLQYEISYTNVLTMLDLGGIALHAEDRADDETLVIAGGPGAQNPELIAPFIDLFVIGDGEPSLPLVCDLWKEMQGSGLPRAEKLAKIAGQVDWAYVPRFDQPIYGEDGAQIEIRRLRDDVPETIKACVIQDLDGS
ncbi:MAG: B12-binding domain-containing radical SAM protein, partial [Isosphaeraceae bacterium]